MILGSQLRKAHNSFLQSAIDLIDATSRGTISFTNINESRHSKLEDKSVHVLMFFGHRLSIKLLTLLPTSSIDICGVPVEMMYSMWNLPTVI